jgi:hypothetical protein
MSVTRVTGITAHGMLVLILILMGGFVLVDALAQAGTGYVPPGLADVVLIAAITLALGVFVAAGLYLWAVRRRPTTLLLADALTTIAAWTVLLPLVSLPGAALPIVFFLAPSCTVFAWLVWRRDRAPTAGSR